MESIGKNVSLTQQVQNQDRLESEQESDNMKKRLPWNKRFSILQVRVKKKKKKKSWLYSDCQNSILTIDGRNAMDSAILQELANPQRVCEAGIMKIGYALSALSKHKPKGLWMYL